MSLIVPPTRPVWAEAGTADTTKAVPSATAERNFLKSRIACISMCPPTLAGGKEPKRSKYISPMRLALLTAVLGVILVAAPTAQSGAFSRIDELVREGIAAKATQRFTELMQRHKLHVSECGEDLPEVRNWKWTS